MLQQKILKVAKNIDIFLFTQILFLKFSKIVIILKNLLTKKKVSNLKKTKKFWIFCKTVKSCKVSKEFALIYDKKNDKACKKFAKL